MKYKKQYREKRAPVRHSKIHPYKSTLEYKVAKEALQEYEYEPKGSDVTYTIPHTYNPDFVHPKQPDLLMEIKGWFIKGHSDCQKYLSIIRDNPDKELIFIFSDPDKKCYAQCKTRKDGSIMTLAEWCRKNLILYFKVEDIPRDLAKGRWNLQDARDYKRVLYGLS